MKGVEEPKEISLSSLGQLPDEAPEKIEVNSFDVLDDAPAVPKIGQSFIDIVADEQSAASKVKPDDASLDSFFRKFPR